MSNSINKDKGYHISDIVKGDVGEISKIIEECEELKDAENQENKILILCELSDLYGAIECYLEKHFSNIKMSDIKNMSDATKRAFESGLR